MKHERLAISNNVYIDKLYMNNADSVISGQTFSDHFNIIAFLNDPNGPYLLKRPLYLSKKKKKKKKIRIFTKGPFRSFWLNMLTRSHDR